jgi:hypothetical protein
VLSAGAAAESANLGSVSLPIISSPIVCLADIKGSGTTANNIAQIYDTRTFTTTQKEFVTVQTTAPSLGNAIVGTSASTLGTLSPITTANARVIGVVVASTGAASTTTPNAIIAIQGPTWMKATAGTAGDFAQTGGATAGYGLTATGAVAGTTMGVNRITFTAGCTAANACANSLYFSKQ